MTKMENGLYEEVETAKDIYWYIAGRHSSGDEYITDSHVKALETLIAEATHKPVPPLTSEDLTHLKWVYARMRDIHGENLNSGYMVKMSKILQKLEEGVIK